MKAKVLNGLLIIASLFGYLEWGNENSSFLFEGEYDVLSALFTDPSSVAHPFTFIPLFGQILLLITLFQRKPAKILTYLGIACIGTLLGFMFFIGLLVFNFKILISTFPFIILSVFVIRNFRKNKAG